jgi:uncharacterized protein YggT (Ycf19 family)
MSWVDLILNIAGLLLWLNWRAGKADPLGRRTPATLLGTLRSAAPQRSRRWDLPAVLGGLIFLRAVLYWLLGPALHWIGILNLGIISLPFRSDMFGRILLFSLLSFLLTLGIFYSWLILLSLLKGPKPVHDFARMQLGGIDGWADGVKWFVPLVVTCVGWWLASWALAKMGIIPHPPSVAWRLGESLVIASQAYLIWKFPIALLLILYLLNSYIYFGKHPIWKYADATAQTLLSPLKKIPLRFGKVDIAPIVGIAVVFFVAEFAERGISFLYRRL